MTHAVLVPNAIAALNVDSYNRSAVCASNVDNGNIVALLTKSATAGESEVWTATVPATNSLSNLWMVYEPEIVITNSQYKGLDPDPRNFFVPATKVFSCFKLQVGDIITLTAEAFSGAKGGSDVYANATNSTGGLVFVWGTTQTSSVVSLHLIATTYISLATGAMDTQRVTAYQFEVVGIA
jgi:hypothetical protein